MSGLRVLDVDERERLLIAVGEDLVEVDAKGARKPLATVPTLIGARYLPGDRKVVVEHGVPAALSLLRVGGRLTPLFRGSEHTTELLGVLPGRVVYRVNRRHRLLFTVVIRNVLVGEEQAVYDRGGAVEEAAVSPNSRYIAIRLPRKLILVDTMPETEDDHVRLISPEPAVVGRRSLHWLPDSARLIATEYSAEHAQIVRYTVASEEWRIVVPDLAPDARVAVAPDGRRIAVACGNTLSFHQTDNGRHLRSATLPTPITDLRWTPNSRTVAIATAAGTAAMVTADRATVREVAL